MHSLKTISATIISASLLIGCASNNSMSVKHGMAPSSTGPTPEWYAQEYGLPRGVGEALRRDNLALWDNETGTYTYTIRGEIYAQFHPWEHFLKVKPDNLDKRFSQECQWSRGGLLNNTLPDEVNPDVAARCNKLIHQLAQEFDLGTE